MTGRGAPVWTGIVMGVLLGLLLGSTWLFLRERAARADPQSGAVVESGQGATSQREVVAEPASASSEVAIDRPSIQDTRRTAIVTATEMVAPAVVSINVIEHRTYSRAVAPPGMEFWERFYPGLFPRREYRQDINSLGSGFIVSSDGYVLTNYHVVQDADEIIVTLSDGRQFPAQLLETVAQHDLALLKIDGQDLPAARLAESNQLHIGEWAIAIGSPFGYLLADTQPTVTVGVISALNRDIKQSGQQRNYLGMIQTDAAINPGNSGGPLIDAEGEVIGINTFIFTESGGSIGIGFAVPIERAKWLIQEVRQFGHYRQAYSGLFLQKLSPNLVRTLGLQDDAGFIVRDVEQDSPAWQAGLRPVDIIRKINGVPLVARDTVLRLIYEAKVGTRLTFEAERDGKTFSGEIVLAELSAEGNR